MAKRLYVKYPFFLSDFNGTWIFSKDSRKKLRYKVSSPRQVVTKLLNADGHIDRRTDGHNESNSRFLQFYERA
jgi:hypothetical protein